MTVAELVAHLGNCPADAIVVRHASCEKSDAGFEEINAVVFLHVRKAREDEADAWPHPTYVKNEAAIDERSHMGQPAVYVEYDPYM